MERSLVKASHLNEVLMPTFERRRDEWFTDLDKRLQAAEAIDFESLETNEQFIDVVVTATQAAIRTSQQGKREALKNAVLSAARTSSSSPNENQLFIGLVDRFTDDHLRLLWVFDRPQQAAQGAPNHIYEGRRLLEHAIPQSIGHSDFFQVIWADLYAAGLVRTPNIDNGPEGDPTHMRRTTDFGRRFISFITSD